MTIINSHNTSKYKIALHTVNGRVSTTLNRQEKVFLSKHWVGTCSSEQARSMLSSLKVAGQWMANLDPLRHMMADLNINYTTHLLVRYVDQVILYPHQTLHIQLKSGRQLEKINYNTLHLY